MHLLLSFTSGITKYWGKPSPQKQANRLWRPQVDARNQEGKTPQQLQTVEGQVAIRLSCKAGAYFSELCTDAFVDWGIGGGARVQAQNSTQLCENFLGEDDSARNVWRSSSSSHLARLSSIMMVSDNFVCMKTDLYKIMFSSIFRPRWAVNDVESGVARLKSRTSPFGLVTATLR